MEAVWKSLLTLGLGLVALTGCVGAQTDDEINFLRAKPSDAPDMEALLEGRLVLSEGCLHIQDDRTSYAALWPFEFSLTEKGDSIQISNRDKEVVAQVGDQVLVGGGEVRIRSQEEFDRNYLGDSQCSKLYRLVTTVIETTP